MTIGVSGKSTYKIYEFLLIFTYIHKNDLPRKVQWSMFSH